MKKRSPVAVLLLPFVTFGIYSIVWQVKTKGELNSQGAQIPTAWLIIVPLVNIWWLWKYSEGVELVTKKEMSAIVSFVLLYLLGFIGSAILQNEFNKLSPQSTTPDTPQAPAPQAPATPAPTA